MCNNISIWVQNAHDYLERNDNTSDVGVTVDFLLNNHCGYDNRTSIEHIVSYLNEHNFDFQPNTFQQTILGKLKRLGIVVTLIYSGNQGGVFIPNNEAEVIQAANQVLKRISSEILNLQGSVSHLNNSENILRYLEELNNIIALLREEL